jgi:hypothetical protein
MSGQHRLYQLGGWQLLFEARQWAGGWLCVREAQGGDGDSWLARPWGHDASGSWGALGRGCRLRPIGDGAAIHEVLGWFGQILFRLSQFPSHLSRSNAISIVIWFFLPCLEGRGLGAGLTTVVAEENGPLKQLVVLCPLCPFMCLPVSRLFWVSSLAYPNLLGTKGYVVVVVVVVVEWFNPHLPPFCGRRRNSPPPCRCLCLHCCPGSARSRRAAGGAPMPSTPPPWWRLDAPEMTPSLVSTPTASWCQYELPLMLCDCNRN